MVAMDTAKHIAVKLIYAPGDCSVAFEEYLKQLAVYNTLQQSACMQGGLRVARPLVACQSGVTYNGTTYPCAFFMEAIMPLPGYTELVHVLLNDDYRGQASSWPQAGRQVSRGYRAGVPELARILQGLPPSTGGVKTINDIAFLMGCAIGAMVGLSHVYPFDVEFLLGQDEHGNVALFVADFGLVEFVHGSVNMTKLLRGTTGVSGSVAGLEDDMYLPQPDSPLFAYFVSGVQQGCAGAPDTAQQLINALSGTSVPLQS